MNKISLYILVVLTVLISGCASIEQYARMHSDNALRPNTFQYKDGGTSIYYEFTTNSNETHNTYVFFYAATGCPSLKPHMPDYINGLSASARVFALNKRFVKDKSMGVFDCGNAFHEANNMQQWFSDYSEFILEKLSSASSPPKNVVLVGVSEAAIPTVRVAASMSEITHLAIIGDGGYTMRDSLKTLSSRGKIPFNIDKGWKEIEANQNSITDSWYGNKYRWWFEIMDYDPMPNYLKLNIPVLVGMGENDESVPVESAYYLESEFKKAGKTNLKLLVYKDANHRLSADDKSYRDEFFSKLSQML